MERTLSPATGFHSNVAASTRARTCSSSRRTVSQLRNWSRTESGAATRCTGGRESSRGLARVRARDRETTPDPLSALRAFLPGRQVRLLLLRQRVEADAHRLQLQPRDPIVDALRH